MFAVVSRNCFCRVVSTLYPSYLILGLFLCHVWVKHFDTYAADLFFVENTMNLALRTARQHNIMRK